jgi:hypothetical protein
MVAHIFGEQLGGALKELKKLHKIRKDHSIDCAPMMARLQAKIIVWEQHLKRILRDIERELADGNTGILAEEE